MILGMLTASPTVFYTRMKYLQEIDFQYNALKTKFREHPELNVPDDDDVQKNFGT